MTQHTWCSRPGEVSVPCCIVGHYVQDFAEAQMSF